MRNIFFWQFRWMSGNNFTLQQDNAPAHCTRETETSDFIEPEYFGRLIAGT